VEKQISKNKLAVAVVTTVGLQLAVIAVLLVKFVSIASGFEKIFKDFGTKLPSDAVLAIETARLVRSYWPLLALLFIAFDATFCWRLYNRGARKRCWLWFLGVVVTLAIYLGTSLFSLAAPLFGLIAKLAEPSQGTAERRTASTEPVGSKAWMMALIDDFFQHNFRDITSRETLEWGDVAKAGDGKFSIRYKWRGRIWDKETKVFDQVFTFDKYGKCVSMTNADGKPAEKTKVHAQPDAAQPAIQPPQ
jgi:hypothetical protein